MTIFISSLCFIAGIAIITWIHSQHHLDIVVDPVHPPEDAPLISVCIPTRNEERNVDHCLEALLAQTYPNFEIIVLDDRSTDSTGEILRGFTTQNDRLKVGVPDSDELMREFDYGQRGAF